MMQNWLLSSICEIISCDQYFQQIQQSQGQDGKSKSDEVHKIYMQLLIGDNQQIIFKQTFIENKYAAIFSKFLLKDYPTFWPSAF